MGKLSRFGRRKKRAEKPRAREGVYIGIPCVGDYIHLGVQRLLALADRLNLDPNSPWSFAWTIEVGTRPVEYARNKLVKAFLASDAERLWMIDADMLPEGEIFALLGVDADLVVPRMLALKRKQDTRQPRLETCGFVYNKNNDQRFNSIIPHQPGVYDCDGAGTGCIVIRRKVLEDRRLWLDPAYEWEGESLTLDDDDAPPIFRTQHAPNGKPLRGEDLDFTWRAKQLGYTVKMAAGIGCGHCKVVNLEDIARIASAGIATAVEGLKDAGTVSMDGEARDAAAREGIR